MPSFLKETLREDRIAGFLKHLEECGDCKEELSIELLVSEGLPSLEKETSFNLNEVLEQRIRDGKKKTEIVRKLMYSIRLGAVMCAMALGVLVYLIVTLGV